MKELRDEGRPTREIGEIVGASHTTVENDLKAIEDGKDLPAVAGANVQSVGGSGKDLPSVVPPADGPAPERATRARQRGLTFTHHGRSAVHPG